ncbi:Major facilitator superfamily domain [Trinorchestia longiramus]|nr:Major facilitator superfamily domain [Trinorchestia longiramus]
MTRATMNLAQMLGPIVGGALYELGGFKLPFLVIGTVQIVVSLASCCILPAYRSQLQPQGRVPEKQKTSVNRYTLDLSTPPPLVFDLPVIKSREVRRIWDTMSISLSFPPSMGEKMGTGENYMLA